MSIWSTDSKSILMRIVTMNMALILNGIPDYATNQAYLVHTLRTCKLDVLNVLNQVRKDEIKAWSMRAITACTPQVVSSGLS